MLSSGGSWVEIDTVSHCIFYFLWPSAKNTRNKYLVLSNTANSSMTCAVWGGLKRCLYRKRTVQDLTLATSDLEFLRSHLEKVEKLDDLPQKVANILRDCYELNWL